MHAVASVNTLFIVMIVVLFMLLGVAIIVIIDHKAKIPGHFARDPFSISGLRRDHPVMSFVTASILGVIILALVLEIGITLGERFGLFAEREEPMLLQKLGEQRVTERMRRFHNAPEVDLPNLGKKPVCFYCHGDYPHSKERMVRTLLNMHTQFVGCMTCHTDPRKVPEDTLTFKWLNYSGIPVEGPPFGTQVDPATGYLQPTDDYYSKIVAYTVKGDTETLLEIPEDTNEVQEFLAIREQLSDKDREAVKKAFHRLVSPKGRFCTRCHTNEKESYLPFRDLGFSQRRIADITDLNIIGIVEKYRKFYMPHLFDAGQALPRVEALVGPEKESGEAAAESPEDPRAWWRKTFDPPAPKNDGRGE